MIDKVFFILGEAFSALRKNGFLTFAAISTAAIAFFLLGGSGYVLWRLENYAQSIPGRFEVRVFLKDGTSLDQIRSTARQFRAIEGVASAVHIPRDAAWKKHQKEFPEETEGIENPFPDAFKITLKRLDTADATIEEIRRVNTVDPQDGVQYLRDEQRLIDQTMRVLKWLGSVLGGLLFVTAGVLVFVAIRLAMLFRRREVGIMRLVGASPVTIHTPFLIEGFVQGAVGGVVAALLIFSANTVVQQQFAQAQTLFVIPAFPLLPALGMLGGVGALYGLFCGILAILLPIKVDR